MEVGFLELGVTGAATALVAGAMGSLHCAVMCGPLACAGVSSEKASHKRSLLAWQAGRVGSYAAIGLALGAAGHLVAHQLSVSVQPYLPWVMAAGLLATAFEVGKHLAPLPGFSSIARALVRWGARVSPVTRAAAMGAATPFLPCGLLYGVFLAAIGAGTGLGGAMVMGFFALGGAPALASAQLGSRWGARWPRGTVVLRRAAAVLAAVTLIWRALHAPEGAPPSCHSTSPSASIAPSENSALSFFERTSQ